MEFSHIQVLVVVPDLSSRFSNGYLETRVSYLFFVILFRDFLSSFPFSFFPFSFFVKEVAANRKEKEGMEELVHCSEASTQIAHMKSQSVGKNLIK